MEEEGIGKKRIVVGGGILKEMKEYSERERERQR